MLPALLVPDNSVPLVLPVAPTLQEWEAFSETERQQVMERLLLETNAVLDEEALHCGEGDTHQTAWSEAKEKLKLYFTEHRQPTVYVAANMTVLYPGETGFSPDILAAVGVPLHPRDSWMVHVEGKGIDLAMEFCKEGNLRKDFEDNVRRYGALRIREYFAIDLNRGLLRGWRLPSDTARTYQPILAQAGRFHSEVLALELAFIDGTLNFFTDNARLLNRQEMLDILERQVDEERARIDKERLRAEAEQARAEAEQARAEAEQARADGACAAVAEAILLVLKLRDLVPTDGERQRLREMRDLPRLQRWLARAAEADSVAAILSDA